ncbi:MAG: carboxypeptidase regulatory-like domain-containing protein [Myxococcales bacterium]|nr:carboxypeptidase regulatory-like domain-containing protein [Myxococcales bacterium]
MKTKAFALLSILSAQAAFAGIAGAQPAAGGGARAGGAVGGGVSLGGPPAGSLGGGAAAAAPGAPAAPASVSPAALVSPDDEWLARDRKLNESPTLIGGVGLLHMPFAQGGAPGQFRVAFTAETFSAGFLCTAEQPCRNPRAGAPNTASSLSHIGGTLALDVQILNWLEAYGSTGAYANSSDQNRPALIQVLGDTQLGLKGHMAVNKVLHVGFAPELWLVNGTGSVGLLGAGTSAKFRGLVTGDLREMKKSLPLRVGATLTYSLDNTGQTLNDVETLRGESVTRIERFGLRVNRVDHFDVNLGAEVFLLKEKVRPFLEYGIQIPVNRQGYACKPNNPSKDGCLANDQNAPSSLTVGARVLPWKGGFALTAAFDIGVTGTGRFIEEVSPTPPWMLYLGAGWAFDTRERPPVETVRVVERDVPAPVKATGLVIGGLVHEDGKPTGVSNAIVSWDEHPQWTSLATGGDGRFTTHDLPPGTYTFSVKAEGYKPGRCAVTLGPQSGAQGSIVQLDCPVIALPRVGAIVGRVKDAETQAVVRGAVVKLVDSQRKPLSGTADDNGSFRFVEVSPGTATVTAEADGYLSYVAPTDVRPLQDNSVDVLLQKKPKNTSVTLGANEIIIKKQIQFALDSAKILPESTALLTEIADVFIRNPRVRRVELQGHTDNSGTPDHNKALSEDRANAVVAWLVAHGVESSRLVARGYGQGKPLVPNVTAANRARNRRVQFIILEQDAATKAGGAAPAAKPGAAKAPAAKGASKPANSDPNFLK